MSRNKEIKDILASREIAKSQNQEQKKKAKAYSNPYAFVKSSTWPKNRR